MRLDIYLFQNNLCKSRTAGRELIKSGGVSVNGRVCDKPSTEVSGMDDVRITGEVLKYVGRGGLKLEPVFDLFKISVEGAVCVDIGASTGGFTDCLLQHGAELVFAVDVGSGQLAEPLLSDNRVISLEKTDIRGFSFESVRERLPEGFCGADFICADVSFISLKAVIPHIYRLLKDGGQAAALIKPQFEAGRRALNKKGIVTDKKIREKTVTEIKAFAADCGFEITGVCESPVTGGDGNIEYIMTMRKG